MIHLKLEKDIGYIMLDGNVGYVRMHLSHCGYEFVYINIV